MPKMCCRHSHWNYYANQLHSVFHCGSNIDDEEPARDLGSCVEVTALSCHRNSEMEEVFAKRPLSSFHLLQVETTFIDKDSSVG